MSAYVEFDLKKFEDNLKELKTKIPNVKFIFPVKCCNNEKVLELVSKYEYGFDISNINEYNIIKKYLNGNEKFDKSRFDEDYTLLSSSIKEELAYIHLHNSDHKDSEKCNDILDEVKKLYLLFQI